MNTLIYLVLNYKVKDVQRTQVIKYDDLDKAQQDQQVAHEVFEDTQSWLMIGSLLSGKAEDFTKDAGRIL